MKKNEQETLNKKLENTAFFEEYKKKHAEYKAGILPRLLSRVFVFSGNLVYGKEPSYEKFKAIEVIARIPYQSWVVASYTLLSMFHADEKKALTLAHNKAFAQVAQDNETMHVVTISCLVKEKGSSNFLLQTLLPLLFSLIYFWFSFFLYIISKKSSLELNYLFENHALAQYEVFLKDNEEKLRNSKISSEYLTFYGRHFLNEYDFFVSIRNDELIHRNESIERIRKSH